MVRRGKDNDHTKSGRLRRRGQYRIQYVMMETRRFFSQGVEPFQITVRVQV